MASQVSHVKHLDPLLRCTLNPFWKSQGLETPEIWCTQNTRHSATPGNLQVYFHLQSISIIPFSKIKCFKCYCWQCPVILFHGVQLHLGKGFATLSSFHLKAKWTQSGKSVKSALKELQERLTANKATFCCCNHSKSLMRPAQCSRRSSKEGAGCAGFGNTSF